MSQRNPMNDRYQTDERRGQTRKSAASMKPKSKPASTVHMQSTTKTKQQKKAEQKAARKKRAEMDNKYYTPPTEEYKRLRRIWWILLIIAIIFAVIAFAGQMTLPEPIAYGTLGAAYVFALAALFFDFVKLRKVRKAYQEEMDRKSKELRAAEKAERAKRAAAGEEEQPQKRSLFGSGFRLSKSKGDEVAEKESKDSAK